ncbi:hypothetical protein AMJ49_02850 [Parcubacteria bacterium DG_74_2]|nr:MAG: hypothetical protein AMJ49_02850 [Parcubacteria bacterium DG_74_2]
MEKKEIKIKAKEEDLKGFYSNLMQISHTREEFCLDFFNVIPPQGVLVARIMVNSSHLKRIIFALQENMKKYEEKFGKVELVKEPEKIFGFQSK